MGYWTYQPSQTLFHIHRMNLSQRVQLEFLTQHPSEYENLEDLVDYHISELLGVSKEGMTSEGFKIWRPLDFNRIGIRLLMEYNDLLMAMETASKADSISESCAHLRHYYSFIDQQIIAAHDAPARYNCAGYLMNVSAQDRSEADIFLITKYMEESAAQGYGPACIKITDFFVESKQTSRAVFFLSTALQSDLNDEGMLDEVAGKLLEIRIDPAIEEWSLTKDEIMLIMDVMSKNSECEMRLKNPKSRFMGSLVQISRYATPQDKIEIDNKLFSVTGNRSYVSHKIIAGCILGDDAAEVLKFCKREKLADEGDELQFSRCGKELEGYSFVVLPPRHLSGALLNNYVEKLRFAKRAEHIYTYGAAPSGVMEIAIYQSNIDKIKESNVKLESVVTPSASFVASGGLLKSSTLQEEASAVHAK